MGRSTMHATSNHDSSHITTYCPYARRTGFRFGYRSPTTCYPLRHIGYHPRTRPFLCTFYNAVR